MHKYLHYNFFSPEALEIQLLDQRIRTFYKVLDKYCQYCYSISGTQFTLLIQTNVNGLETLMMVFN